MREICFDTETTGLDPKDGDRIIEIGCVEIIDRKITGNTFREIINPERKNSAESINITGLTDEILKDKPFFREIADKFLEFIGDSQLIAHNANFDINFINYELSLMDKEPLKNNVIDSLNLAKIRFPGKKNNLDVLCERFNIDNSARDKHGALLDAELLAEVYLHLTQEEQSQFFKENVETQQVIEMNEFLKLVKNNTIREKREFKISIEDEEAHKKFIDKNVSNSLWSQTTEYNKN